MQDAAGFGANGHPAERAQRADAAHAALRHVAFNRCRAVDLRGAEPVHKPVHQNRYVGAGILIADQADPRLLEAERLDQRNGEAHGLDAKPRIDTLELLVQQSGEMAGTAVRTGRPDADRLLGAIDALEDEIEPPCPFSAALQLRADEAPSGGQSHRTTLPGSAMARGMPAGRPPSLGGAIGSIGSLTLPRAWSMRRMTTLTKPQRERRPRSVEKLADAVEAKPGQGGDRLRVQPQSRDRQGAERCRGLTGRHRQ